MNKLALLRDKKAALLAILRGFVEPLTTEQEASWAATKLEVETINKQISREEALVEEERSMLVAASAASPAQPDNPAPARIEVLGATSKFKTLGEQLLAVRDFAMGNRTDNRLAANPQGMSEAVGADGGFLVQQDFAELMLNQAYETGDILSRVMDIPISNPSNGLKIPIIDESSRAIGSQFGGIQIYWENEAGSASATKPKIGRLELSLKKLQGFCYMTDELLADSSALGAVVQQAFAQALQFMIEDSFINGDGAGKPLGILKAGALVSVAKETSQAASTILPANISKMWARLPNGLRRDAIWLAHPDVEPQLDAMVLVGRNAANTDNIGIAVPNAAVYRTDADGNPLLKGRRVFFTEYNPALSTQGDIVLANMKQYISIRKGTIETAQSMHVAFLTGEQVFRITARIDGQPGWKQSVTPARGSNKISPFITLDAR